MKATDAPRRPTATLDDVARAAFVAKSTASRALRGDSRIAADTRRRVTEVALALGYEPLGERSLSHVAGIVAASGMDDALSDRFQLEIVAGIAEGLNALGMCVLFVPPFGTQEHDAIVTRIPLDVCFLLHGFSTYASTRASLERRGVPVLVLEAEDDDPAPSVRTHEREAYGALMRLLVEAGHTQVAVVSLPTSHHGIHRGFVEIRNPAEVEVIPTRERLTAMYEAGLNPVAIFETTRSIEEEGVLAALALLDRGELPTAIVCHSDLLAVGVMTTLLDAGVHIPQDVSVTGFDGLDMPLLAPLVLATVHQDGFEKGRLLADQARRLLAGQAPPAATLDTTLRIGNTVTTARRGPLQTRGAAS